MSKEPGESGLSYMRRKHIEKNIGVEIMVRDMIRQSVKAFLQSKICSECGLFICNHLGYFEDPKTGLTVRNYGKPT